MRILVIHQHYLRPGQSGGSRFNEMARVWAARGHEVTVIAGTVDHFSGEVPERYRGRWLTREMDGPVTVYRCYVPNSYRNSYFGRKWAFLGFTFSASTAAFCADRPDVIIATSPPLITAIPGWIGARFRLKPIPWIFEVRDLWPESAVTTGVLSPNSALTKLLYGLEKMAYRTSDKINVLTPAFKEDIERRGLAGADKIVMVPNGADTDLFYPESRENSVRLEFGWGDRFVALYAGAHSLANALHQLVEAAAILKNRADILIACVGDGPERTALEQEAASRGLTNIRFHGVQPKSRMPAIVNACDLGLAVLQNNPTFRTVYPNKVFDYMACERPVLVAIDGVARDLVCTQAQAGIFAEPENPEAIANAIMRLADNPGECGQMARNGRRWVLANAARESLAARYLQVMETLAPGKSNPVKAASEAAGSR